MNNCPVFSLFFSLPFLSSSMDVTRQSRSAQSPNDIDFDYRDSQSNPSDQSQGPYVLLHPESSERSEASDISISNVLLSLNGELAVERPEVDANKVVLKNIFPLFDLPSEIRLIVYRMAFCRDTPVLFRARRQTPEVEEDDCSDDDISHNSIAPYASSTRQYGRGRGPSARKKPRVSPPEAKPCEDALVPQLLRVCKRIYQEARPVLYSENTFVLELDSAAHTLISLSQPSRSSIKHINLSIPTHHDIIEGFADLVRLHLRYCWGLKKLTLTLPHFLPQDRYAASSAANVYANSFHILRWLPQGTEVLLDGGATDDIRRVIAENTRIGRTLDKVSGRLVLFPRAVRSY
jgi:hypothetical protein